MQAASASLLNVVVLVAVGLWGFVTSGSGTSLIPVGFGLVIGAMNPGIRKKNKVIAHRAVGLTLLVLIALGMPLKSALADGRTDAVARVGLMMASSAIALVFFVRSFLAARQEKAAAKETESAESPGNA
ncbi:MAG: hypothetical protein AAF958_11015 [Planctomycetota bacterium]